MPSTIRLRYQPGYRLLRRPWRAALLSGWAVWLQSLACLAILPLFVVTITELQIKPEEAAMRKLFGDEYQRYCDKVGRWI